MRIEGWDDVFSYYLEAARGLQFEWGVNDCALWACSFVDLITGSSYADDWRGQYGDEDSAKQLMAVRGFKTYAEIVDKHLQETRLKSARRGDLVLHESGALGICDGRRSWFLGQNGIRAVLTLNCKKAWRTD